MTRLVKYDMVYISYDEPNCEENWADLRLKVPWAKRVHKVKGFDAAHKAAADLAETDYFITVDGDNIIYPEIIDYEVDEHLIDRGNIISLASKNNVNGLIYGNGGLKIWPKAFVQNMNTHESHNGKNVVDFCWDSNYKQRDVLSSETIQTGSAYQSFRSGFREGVKMTLDQGKRVNVQDFHNVMYYGNIDRLRIWCSIGEDVEYGNYAIYGARLGAYMTLCTDWNHDVIADYDWFIDFWTEQSVKNISKESLKYMNMLNDLAGLKLTEYKFIIS